MVSNVQERELIEEINAENGTGRLTLDKLLLPPHAPAALRTYAKATLEPGASVGFHMHSGESESYYIIAGTGEYSDNGEISVVTAGTITYTPSGSGHGIRNIGTEPLEFMALIIRDDV